MNPFDAVMRDFGFHAESQGVDSATFVLLDVLRKQHDANPVAPTFACPYSEVFHQLRDYANTAAIRALRAKLNSKVCGA